MLYLTAATRALVTAFTSVVPKASSLCDDDGDELAPEDKETEEVATEHLLVNAEKHRKCHKLLAFSHFSYWIY